ncbi:MAG: hypothetical protein AB1649_27170 [Chloroflexota bacterium]
MQKVSDWIDIEAPCEEVFATVIDVRKRMQLSPIWGLSQLRRISEDFPEPGSSYWVRVLTDAPYGIAGPSSHAARSAFEGFTHILLLKMGQNTSSAEDVSEVAAPAESAAEEAPEQKSTIAAEQEYIVDEYEPPHKLSYHLDADCKTIITWRFQSIPRGTRVNYEEVFCKENISGEDFLPTVRHVIHEWLNNIKRYSELRGTRGREFARKVLDRWFLKLRPDQRRTVLLILFMQAIAIITFIVAVIGLGIAGWLF